MKTFQQILATILLALVLAIPTYAGDMSGPTSVSSPAPVPTDGVKLVITAPPTVPGNLDPPALAMLALDFLVSTLSMY